MAFNRTTINASMVDVATFEGLFTGLLKRKLEKLPFACER